MPVGRPRVGRFSLRIPEWLHEELAAEAYRRNVSLNQLCFEALVARRALVKKPQVQQTLEKLDKRRTRDRAVIQQEVVATVVDLARAAPNRPKPDETSQRILDALGKIGRPATVQDLHEETGIEWLVLTGSLVRLELQRWIRRLAGERYQLERGLAAHGIAGFG